ncbi:MAG: DUF2207 domain-containing protein [Saprospiraceae bacterium]|nr:DUF2207 domain-containing protein [Saprospiraceae bacterium]
MGCHPRWYPGFLLLAWKKLRGNDDDDEMVPQPYPPLDLTPAEVGAFYDHIVHDRDVISLLPYWAYQGFITIAYDKSSGDMRLTKVKNLEGERPTYEYTLFNGLFDYRSTVDLSDLKYKFYSTQTQVKSQIRKEIIDLQMYDDQYRYWFKTWRIWLFFVCLIPIMALSFIYGYWMAGIVVIFAMIAVIVVASVGSKTSEKGRRVKQELRGFHTFLKNDDTSQYPDLIKNDPSYFEKVYPYALAFGLDKSWLSKIKPYQTMAPMWYGYYGPYAHDYNRSMDSFSEGFSPREISSAFTTMPASSGGSGGGFSGGSSGGGFGGGGGSSW